jgi:hypothetical protein
MSEASCRRQPWQAESRGVHHLADRLRAADAVTPALLSDVMREVCSRFVSIPRGECFSRIERLIQANAWTDVVLALLELELPQWRLRRIVYDEGEWHCALSRQRELPDWLDQSIEASHADLALAILCAFVEVKRIGEPPTRTSSPRVPRAVPLYTPMCCDNFS